MHVIHASNVNDAYVRGLEYIQAYGRREESRNGPVLVAETPVCTAYKYPMQRVLFDLSRKANPFFHLMESVWMLAGQNDAAFLDQYVKDFGKRYAQSDGKIHGAYGYRWRNWPHDHGTFDQLLQIIQRLAANPQDRQAVLQMWNPDEDLWPDSVFPEPVKDRPCNTTIYFRILDSRLDMTVCCRSNDIIWGAYGANAVHMSFLQEYVASAIGIRVGTYYQISNNYHAYLDTLTKVGQPRPMDRYRMKLVKQHPILGENEHYGAFLTDCSTFCKYGEPGSSVFLKDVVKPLALAHEAYRDGNLPEAIHITEKCAAEDWRAACLDWLGDRAHG